MKSYMLGGLLGISICVILVKLLSAGENSKLIQPWAFPYRFVSCQCEYSDIGVVHKK